MCAQVKVTADRDRAHAYLNGADYTAVALLMPLNQVYQYLELNNYQSASKGKKKKLVRELCEVYEVSEIIAIRRIKEVYAIQQKSF